ncbi:phage tail protein [Actinocrispum wychmicini]|uniref:Phage-related protein n=1 Tax=Actinocrispum wychmicini TaxID=1213861 RepID=A0A4V2S8P1_9PSEU|nr:hypothetical protein [Actinocrispum wychmicini]TCO64390.1 hypothetical protein EV192_101158 [Actinocrispum wychmicini]
MALTIGELVGYLRVDDDGWHRGLARARAALAEASKGTAGDLGNMADQVSSAGNKAAANLAQLALSLSKVATAASALHEVNLLVTQLSGVIGLLPAAGAAAVAGMIALKVGMSGFGDAMKNAGDPEKFAESLGKLAPAARDTAVAARDLAPAWRSVQQSVQNSLFAGVAQDVRTLGSRYLPVLKVGLSGIAGEFNTATRTTAGFLSQSRQVGTVSGIFGNLRAAIGNTTTVVQPLVSILLDVVSVGSEFLPGMTKGFGDSARAAAQFVQHARETGKLRDWIGSGLDTLHQLGQVLHNIVSIAKTVFDSLDTGGAGLLTTLVNVTGGVRDFLKSVQGQEALQSLASVLSTVSTVTSTVLLTALRQLAPVVVELAPGFAELARQVGSVLVTALQFAGPLLQSVARFLSDNAGWLGPLAIGLYGAAQAFQVVTGVMRVLSAVASVNPWVLLITATVALATLVVSHWDAIKDAVSAAWSWLSDRAAEVWGWIERNIVEHIVNAARWVGDRVGDILDFFGWLAALPGKAAEWFAGIARWAGDKLADAVRFFRDLPGNILSALGDLGSLLVNAGRDIVLGLLRGLESLAGRIWDWIKGIAQRIWDGITDFFDIFSPSKKMAWAGRMIGLGLAEGLDAMNGKVLTAADQLAAAGMVTVPAPVIRAPALSAVTRTPAATPPPPATPVLVGTARDALVHIENYHPPADATPGQVASDLDWLMRGGGR